MAARSPLERGRCAEPDMVPADPGGALGAELWAVKEGPCHSIWAFPQAECGNRVPYATSGRRIWHLKLLPKAYG